MDKKLTALIILDGFGLNQGEEGNAIKIAETPYIDALLKKYPNTHIGASGESVGLPDGQMGNSEVGHLNIGAGRIVYQELTRITKSIKDGDFFQKEEFLGALNNCKEHASSLHLMGLCSDGGVHSHLDHLYAILELAKRQNVTRVYIHCFMDGRDVPPKSGRDFIEQIEAKTKEIGLGRIATVMGRYYSMDRDNRYERVKKAYDAMVLGEGLRAKSAVSAMKESYERGETDEFVLPTVIISEGEPLAKIQKNDSIIFFNFRPDRAREISRTFIDPEFKGFERKLFKVHYVCMTEYDATFTEFKDTYIAYKPTTLSNTLGQYLSKQKKTQIRIAETEKYAHVTFFFNGGVEYPNEGEERSLIPSPKVATYDLKPEMSAYEVAQEAVARIESGAYDCMILNFANADMVGHTGVLSAAVDAVTAVDKCVEKVASAIIHAGGQFILTADHGNSEMMIDPETGGPFTAHTTFDVPLILVSQERMDVSLREDGILADIAPTLLELMDLPKPDEMTGKSLILK